MKYVLPFFFVAAVSAQDLCGTITCTTGFACIILDELPYPSFGCGQTTSTSATACPDGGIGTANWGQCGGIGYTGSTCCVDAPDWLCIYSNAYHSQCLQVSNSSAVTTTTTITTSLPTTLSASTASSASPTVSCTANWGMCGGIEWTGPTCCQGAPDWFCEYENDYFSMCHPVTTSSVASPTTSTLVLGGRD